MVLAVAHSPHTQRHLSPTSGDSTLEQLRQSLSRSPSRGATTFRLFTSRTSSPTQSPRAPSANAPEAFSLLTDASTTLFPVSAKKRKPLGALRYSPMRSTRGSLGTQRGQAPRRILQESSDHGNSSLHTMMLARDSPSPNEMQISPDENMLAPHHALGRREKPDYFSIAKSSPLKRSESNFDIAQSASPSAKRRSLHGASFAPDFNIMEQENLFEDSSENMSTPTQSSPVPRKRASLRSPVINTRFDTVPAYKSRPTIGNIWDIQAAKARNRLSLDFPLPDNNNDSPFSFDSSQPPKELPTLGKLTLPPRHPLSRTITQSSSNSDVAEDSPTHQPIRHLGNFSRPFSESTRSLPVGIARPSLHPSSGSDDSSSTTPQSHRMAKPEPQAFHSTGLLSKKNRNLTEAQMELGATMRDMPDTPCKRPSYNFTAMNNNLVNVGSAAPSPAPGHSRNTSDPRHNLHAFGTPTNLFNPRKSLLATGGTPTIFGQTFNQGSARRGSFAENLEEIPKSPLLHFHARNQTTVDLPPTPTKQSSASNSFHEARNPDALNDRDVAVMDTSPIDFSKRVSGMHPSTPLETVVPPDPSSLTISGHGKTNPFDRRPSFNDSLAVNLPATPTAARDSFGRISSFGISVTPSHQYPVSFSADYSLTSRFDRVEPLSSGEFSHVWRVYALKSDVPKDATSRRSSYKEVAAANSVWAVKKSKAAYLGRADRARKLQEAEILKALGKAEHTVEYFDSWEFNDHLYIQTEYCEEGTLQSFLARAGQSARLDDFRIWKIMLEMSKGLKHIHDAGYIHLDIKPANVLVSFEGVLKIADFGMASAWPAPRGIEGEGDREYIGPEVLEGKFDKPADVFAFGLMMLEIAANVVLPENGASWLRLRSGDLSDVGSLTSSSDLTSISRDASGNPTSSPGKSFGSSTHTDSSFAGLDFGFEPKLQIPSETHGHRFGELKQPPAFMLDAENSGALDKVVRWMITPEYRERPLVDDLLALEGVRWVEARRRAGATIFEGNWGPADDVLHHDSEMIDV